MRAEYSLTFVVAPFSAVCRTKRSQDCPKTIADMWLFDEDKGDVANDSSGNGNDGTLANGPNGMMGDSAVLWSSMV